MDKKQNVACTDNGLLLSVEKKEVLTQATTQMMNLGDVMLNEINQAQKGKFFMIPLVVASPETESGKPGRGWGWGWGGRARAVAGARRPGLLSGSRGEEDGFYVTCT